jgi:malic enzyme
VPWTVAQVIAVADQAAGLTTSRKGKPKPQQPHRSGCVAAAPAGWTRTSDGPPNLADVVANTAPTILIGLSTAAGAFDESIVR